MGGVNNTMNIYIEKENSTLEISEVEILCSKKELDILIDALVAFQCDINKHVENNNSVGGFTHMHTQDNIDMKKENNKDIVFYVDLAK